MDKTNEGSPTIPGESDQMTVTETHSAPLSKDLWIDGRRSLIWDTLWEIIYMDSIILERVWEIRISMRILVQ